MPFDHFSVFKDEGWSRIDERAPSKFHIFRAGIANRGAQREDSIRLAFFFEAIQGPWIDPKNF